MILRDLRPWAVGALPLELQGPLLVSAAPELRGRSNES